jgi:hypothetical protein
MVWVFDVVVMLPIVVTPFDDPEDFVATVF